MYPSLGFIGTILIAVAYTPQIYHLIKAKCAACISIPMWSIWTVATVLIGIHAYSGNDTAFKAFTLVNLVGVITTLIFAIRYRTQTCTTHEFKKAKR